MNLPPEPPRQEDPLPKTSLGMKVAYAVLILLSIPVVGILLLFGTCMLSR